MDVTVYSYPSGDPVLIDKIVNEFLSQGKFDKLRKECMADADTKPAYQNLQLRVESIVSQFLKKQIWKPDLNKNQLRDSLRKHILESGFLDAGINRIVDQIVNPNVLATVFMPEVEEVVYSYLSIPRPGDKAQKQCDHALNISNNNTGKHWLEESKIAANELDEVTDPKNKIENEESQSNGLFEKVKAEDSLDKNCYKLSETFLAADHNVDIHRENTGKDSDDDMKHEVEHMVIDQDSNLYGKEEFKPDLIQEDANDKFIPDKMELPSDDSQESLSRMGVERLRISESDGVNAPDSDASVPLEINEKSMSESRDSDDSIMNKMSPISQGRLTPDDLSLVEEEKGEKDDERKEKNPLTFVGRIPKIKRDDSESSTSSKKDDSSRVFMKSVYSSDESYSSKHSFSKSDSDDKRSKEKKKNESSSKIEDKYDKDKKYKEDEKRRKSDHHKSGDGKSHSKDSRNKDDKLRKDEKDKSHSRSRDEKRDKSRDKSSIGDKKSSSSSSSSHSRSKSSSSHHKNVHKSGSHDKEHHRDDSRSRDRDKSRHDKEHHRDDSRSRDRDRSRHDRKDKDKRDFDKRKRDEEKRKKSKSVDDHGKERNKREDRRSTDRDSNERERDKNKESTSSRVQSDSKKREKDSKVDDTRKEKNQGEETDRKEEETVVVSRTVDVCDVEKAETIELEYISDGIVHGEMIIVDAEESVLALEMEETAEIEALNLKSLCSEGALTKVQFPKVIDDFYVKFNSTGFRYFEEWETAKMDCEDEFKEYIDEAEKDLSLLSDDGSDYESLQDHLKSESLKLHIVSNSLRGLGNFEESIIFDPDTYDFFRWTSKDHYRRQFGSSEKVDSKPVCDSINWSPGLTEDDEIHCLSEKNKENHERDRKVRKSLKLLSRYHRKMGLKFKHGKEQHKFVRRGKKHENDTTKVRSIWNNWSEEQAKWRVLNASENVESHDGKEMLPKSLEEPTAGTVEDKDVFEEQEDVRVNEAENCSNVMDSTAVLPNMDMESKMRLYQVQSIRGCKSESCMQNMTILGRLSSGSREDDEEEEENVVKHTGIRKRGIRIGLSRPKPSDLDGKAVQKKMSEHYHLPLSPESDDSTFSSNGVITPKKELSKNQRKRGVDLVNGSITTDLPTKKMKDHRRTVSQKYDSQDLYKPRPFSIGSKTRGRALRVEDGFTKIESTQK